MFVDGGGLRGGRGEETPRVTAAELNEAPGPRRMKERISLLINILI